MKAYRMKLSKDTVPLDSIIGPFDVDKYGYEMMFRDKSITDHFLYLV